MGDFDRRSGRYTLYTGIQGPHGLRAQLAEQIFRVPHGQVRVVTDEVGGSFGMGSGYTLFPAGKGHPAVCAGCPLSLRRLPDVRIGMRARLRAAQALLPSAHVRTPRTRSPATRSQEGFPCRQQNASATS